MSPRGRQCAKAAQQPDEPWARTSDRNVWRAYKGGLVLTVTRVADGSGWQAVGRERERHRALPGAAADQGRRSAVGGQPRWRVAMTRAERRIADLEQQLTDLAVRFAQLERDAFLVKTLQEVAAEHAGYQVGQRAALKTSRPRHLRAVEGVIRPTRSSTPAYSAPRAAATGRSPPRPASPRPPCIGTSAPVVASAVLQRVNRWALPIRAVSRQRPSALGNAIFL